MPGAGGAFRPDANPVIRSRLGRHPAAYLSGMMGRTHAAIGLAAGAGIGFAAFGLQSAKWLIPAVAVRGAAVLPDLDEPNSSVDREFGIVSRGFSVLVEKAAGGHRKLTHSLLGMGIVVAVLMVAVTGTLSGAVLFGLLAATAWRIVTPWWSGVRWLFLPAGFAAGWLFDHLHPIAAVWVVALLGAGWLLHMAGDFLTKGGVPLLYPNSKRFCAAVFGATGSTAEGVLAVAIYAGVAVAAGFWLSHHAPAITAASLARILPLNG